MRLMKDKIKGAEINEMTITVSIKGMPIWYMTHKVKVYSAIIQYITCYILRPRSRFYWLSKKRGRKLG